MKLPKLCMIDYEKYLTTPQVGDEVTGHIVGEDNQGYYLDIPGKYMGYLSSEEDSLIIADIIDPEDGISVLITELDDEAGIARCSIEQLDEVLKHKKYWRDLATAYWLKDAIPFIPDRVVGMNAGIVGKIRNSDIEAFLPKPHAAIKNLEWLLNRELEVNILELDIEKQHLVVSRQEIAKREYEERVKARQEEEVIANSRIDIKDIKVGDEIEVTTKGTNPKYGVFCKVVNSDIKGLIKINQENRAVILQGEPLEGKIKVKVSHIDTERNRLNLTL